MTLRLVILLAIVGSCTAAPQFVIQTSQKPYLHPAVLLNSAMEANLPSELKNNFYKNPELAAGLARESWFAEKEMQVVNRATDNIPRGKIYNILHNAGFTHG